MSELREIMEFRKWLCHFQMERL